MGEARTKQLDSTDSQDVPSGLTVGLVGADRYEASLIKPGAPITRAELGAYVRQARIERIATDLLAAATRNIPKREISPLQEVANG